VWPYPQGKERGIAFEPLYRTAPGPLFGILRFINTWFWRTHFETGACASGSMPNRNFTVDSRRQMRNPNLDQLVATADALRPLLPELVFVGGCVTGLLITEEGAGEPRGTFDVDAIAEIMSYAQYAEFGDRLRRLGFHEDTSEGAPVCRWTQGRKILDLMPLEEKILGFSNRWYKAAIASSVTKELRDHLEIRMVTAPCFLATKLERSKGEPVETFSGVTTWKILCRWLTDAKL